MSRRPVLHAVVIAAAAACPIIAVPIAAFAQGAAPSSTSAIGQPDWPRAYRVGNDTLQLYPPTSNSYAGDQVSGTMAFALGPTSGAPVYGRASFSATARADAAAGTVRLSRIRLSDLDIPLAPDRASAVRQMLAQKLRDQSVSLPASLVAADVARASAPPPVVNTTPPAIAFADGPSLLIPVAGPPDWRAVPGGTGFQRVLNTQALLLKDVDQVLHLKAAGLWYEATTLSGPWIPTPEVPPDVQAAATAAEAQQPTDPLLPPSGQPPVNPPAILVATTPTELIQTDGPPKTAPVAGTQLTTWDNADHAVFVTPGTDALYILISGRWFTAASTSGPWTYVAPDALPVDFARIAPTDPKANVLISVAGTPQARNAAIAATLPQTAAVPLSATANVSYEGAPHFVPISGTQLSYAQNTATPVIRVAPDQLYTVSNGVWFSATGPTGPWRVATSVPDAIYAIPAASPVHYVTGVRVYGTSGSSVITGYTPAYMGVLPGPGGTVVYGSGYVTPGYVGTRWIAPPVTYGVGAGFAAGPRGFGYGFSPGWSWGGGAGPGWGPYAGATPYGRGWGFADVGAANIYGRWGEGVAVGGGWGGVGFGVSAWSHGAWGGVGVSIGAGGVGFGYGGFSAYGGRYMSQNVNIHNTYNNNHTTIINNDNHNTYNNNHNNDNNNNNNNRNNNNRNSDNNNNNNGRDRPDPRNPSGSNPGGDGNRGQNGDHGQIGPDGRPDSHQGPGPARPGQGGASGQPDTHQGPGPAEPNGSGSQNRGETPQGPGPARPGQGGASGQPDTHQGPGPAEPNGSGSQNRGGTPQGPGPARPGQGGASGQPDTHQGPGPAEPNGSGSQNRGGTPQGPGPARPGQGGASGQPDTHQGPGPAEPNGSGSQNRGETPQGPGPARPGQGGASGQPDTHQGPGPAQPNGSGSQNRGETPQGPGPARQPQSGGGGKSDASQGLSPSEQKGSSSRTGTPGELGPQTPSENKNSDKQTRPASQDDAARDARSADRPSDAATSGDRGRGRDESGTDRSGADARRDGEDRNRDDRRDDSDRRSEDRGDRSAHREEGHHEGEHHEERHEEHHEDEHHGDHDRR